MGVRIHVVERAVSYRIHRARPQTIRLWTIQPIEVWTALQAEKVLYTDENLIKEIDDYREAYDWMRDQMRRRIPGYEGRYPWWAYDYKLDLRSFRYQTWPPDTRHVRLELAVPEAQVLLSGYGDWHFVLNHWYLPQAVDPDAYEREDDAWDAELEERGIDRFRERLPEPYRSRMVRSWERIFDVAERRKSNTIQATFERLALDDVVAVTEFTTAARR